MKMRAQSVSRVCDMCPFNSTCPKAGKPQAVGYCQEASIWVLFGIALLLTVQGLF